MPAKSSAAERRHINRVGRNRTSDDCNRGLKSSRNPLDQIKHCLGSSAAWKLSNKVVTGQQIARTAVLLDYGTTAATTERPIAVQLAVSLAAIQWQYCASCATNACVLVLDCPLALRRGAGTTGLCSKSCCCSYCSAAPCTRVAARQGARVQRCAAGGTGCGRAVSISPSSFVAACLSWGVCQRRTSGAK